MTETEHPEWVYERAAMLMNAQYQQNGFRWTSQMVRENQTTAIKALCAHILKHEEAPVDPLLVEAREIVACNPTQPYSPMLKDMIRKGDFCGPIVNLVLHALQRGGEIEREKRP